MYLIFEQIEKRFQIPQVAIPATSVEYSPL